MTTKLDELLEKWREEAERVHISVYVEAVRDCIADIEAIKNSLNDPVDEPPTKPLPSKDKRLWLTEQEKCLEAWMMEVTYILERTVNWDKGQRLNIAFAAYRKSIGKP